MHGMPHHKLEPGGRVYILLHPVVQFFQFILIVRNVGIQIPCEILSAYDVTVERNLHATVHHSADITPAIAFSGNSV